MGSNVIQDCLLEAAQGRHIAQKHYSRHSGNGKQRVAVLVFPDDDQRLLTEVSRYLDRFLHQSYYDLAVVLSSVDFGQNVQSLTSKQVYVYDLNQSDMNAVLRFYSFAGGADIRVLSFRMPFNTKADDLIGLKNVTADTLVFYSLFGMIGREEAI